MEKSNLMLNFANLLLMFHSLNNPSAAHPPTHQQCNSSFECFTWSQQFRFIKGNRLEYQPQCFKCTDVICKFETKCASITFENSANPWSDYYQDMQRQLNVFLFLLLNEITSNLTRRSGYGFIRTAR